MKKFLIKNWWVTIPILPFLIMILLHISIALGDYFNINFNIPNIHADDWFMFFSSYLGGFIALLGVILTIRHSQQLHQHQISIAYLQKEEEAVADVLSSLPINKTLNIMGIYATGISVSSANVENSKENIREIYLCQTTLTQAKVKLAALSYILHDYSNCLSCKDKCNLNDIAPKFKMIYEELESTIDFCLQYLYEYIRARDISLAYTDMLKENVESINNSGHPLYSEERLNDIKNSARDTNLIFDDFKKYNDKLLALRATSISKLISLSKQYFTTKKQNCHKKCFENWKEEQ